MDIYIFSHDIQSIAAHIDPRDENKDTKLVIKGEDWRLVIWLEEDQRRELIQQLMAVSASEAQQQQAAMEQYADSGAALAETETQPDEVEAK